MKSFTDPREVAYHQDFCYGSQLCGNIWYLEIAQQVLQDTSQVQMKRHQTLKSHLNLITVTKQSQLTVQNSMTMLPRTKCVIMTIPPRWGSHISLCHVI